MDKLHSQLIQEAIPVSPKQLQQLHHFTALLHEWNAIHNLTGAKTDQEIYDNIIDALYPITFIETPFSILDVGTGAGFPGLILAIIYPDTPTVLCEPRNKRASFLKYAAMELGLTNVTVIKKRVEQYHAEPFGLISSRAVTNTKMLLALTHHLQNNVTHYLFYKGEQVFQEIDAVGNAIDYDIIEKNQRNYLYIKG